MRFKRALKGSKKIKGLFSRIRKGPSGLGGPDSESHKAGAADKTAVTMDNVLSESAFYISC